MLLSDVEIGKKYKIISNNNSQAIKKRLNNIGLNVGVVVTAVRFAPLGDPMEIKVRDFYLALRLSQAKNIEVVEIE